MFSLKVETPLTTKNSGSTELEKNVIVPTPELASTPAVIEIPVPTKLILVAIPA